MKKIFLYLYPIEEYTKMFLYDDKTYSEWKVKNPLLVLNECITKRYREKGYQVVFALYPDKKIYGVVPTEKDKIVFTDISFQESSVYDEKGNKKINFEPKYPNEEFIISQLGDIDELVIGGYHAQDCVKRVGEKALSMGIDTIIDLDLTDLFYSLYKQDNYFNIEEYSLQRYKEYFVNKSLKYGGEFVERMFNENYSSNAYGFNLDSYKKRI